MSDHETDRELWRLRRAARRFLEDHGGTDAPEEAVELARFIADGDLRDREALAPVRGAMFDGASEEERERNGRDVIDHFAEEQRRTEDAALALLDLLDNDG